MAEKDPFARFRELEGKLDDFYEYAMGKIDRGYPQIPISQDQIRIIEHLQAQLITQIQRAETAERKVADLQAELLEQQLQQLKEARSHPLENYPDQGITLLLRTLRRRFSIKYHPDKIGANRVMGQINRALDFLEDPEHSHL